MRAAWTSGINLKKNQGISMKRGEEEENGIKSGLEVVAGEMEIWIVENICLKIAYIKCPNIKKYTILTSFLCT